MGVVFLFWEDFYYSSVNRRFETVFSKSILKNDHKNIEIYFAFVY